MVDSSFSKGRMSTKPGKLHIGYFIAALSPLAAGLAKDILGNFSSALVALALLLAGLFALCGRFSPTSQSITLVGELSLYRVLA
ncbi:hypothetical protein [Halomonas caseinilytica]|uniref:hypothetical protein n=1 Tax=Halomonas caseinilytica TaxID=438744 RepID=UPI0007E56377|nr:hypothetical protein [Halomonas caseinilytica]SEN54341.1 hypothetical protein SAMN04487952_1192 [Halomonas caseinilytica]